ncbi:unnamed protein product [marine sediment metagenome]|uniref:Uncharacterized protein n=1 Tax=marine sediment metagenome TaxID=412755 RepID=X1A9S5_9ZZZZ
MDKAKTLREISNLSDKILKTGDEESVLAAHALRFVCVFLARGYIQLLMAFFGNLATLMKWTEDEKGTKRQLVVPAVSDIVAPN